VLAVGLQTTRPNQAEPKALEQKPGRSAGNRTGDWFWHLLVGLAVALCFVLRAWQIDTQPPDEDEYVSIQASLAIAKPKQVYRRSRKMFGSSFLYGRRPHSDGLPFLSAPGVRGEFSRPTTKIFRRILPLR
jgi:hypothetical protein